MISANFPVDEDGRTYHVGLKRGEVCNRIITVGDPERARKLAQLLDQTQPPFTLLSHRGFYTVTGTYQGVPVSIVAIGMGMAMMDFFVREIRAVVDGPMAILRLGSCGSTDVAGVGDIIVPTEAVAVTRHYDYFQNPTASEDKPYHISLPVTADATLVSGVMARLSALVGTEHVHSGLNATCDSFYSSQGRDDANFIDANEKVLSHLKTVYPQLVSLEMETFMLYHLARTAQPLVLPQGQQSSIHAAAAMMVFADRTKNQFISKAQVDNIEAKVGGAILDALIQYDLGTAESLHPSKGSVWETGVQRVN
ncbi:hypothetical protein IWQ62_004748 [Dispira parvispora]|uniref:Nucleoside phosphorylase domain-containing protein n=1 Tax=Dispira parvispora TaxID=1520584 RepID=A0A9W8E551_9FUNG|nr:hypothetical protein IWQ62_004748 [Dispira parvispora]